MVSIEVLFEVLGWKEGMVVYGYGFARVLRSKGEIVVQI
jgi:hypothetical protein